MNSDSSIVGAVQSAVLELFELIEDIAKIDVSDKEQEFKDDAQRTVLMFIAAIILADRNYNPTQRSFLSLLVNCGDLPGGEARYLNEYAVRWVEASKQVPGFFEAAIRHDADHQTEVARSMLRQIQLIGNNACAADGCVRPGQNQMVQQYIKFLEGKLEAMQTPRIVVEETPPVLPAVDPQTQIHAPVQPDRFTYRGKAELRWIGPAEPIDILGFHVTSAMVYISDGDPATAEASAINIRLPIGQPERGEHAPLNYYPQYNWISPDQRAGDRYVAVIDCRGSKGARRFFSRWHEIAHLLTLYKQMELPFHRSTIDRDPTEKLMDVIAGEIGFYKPIFEPVLISELKNQGQFTFALVENVRSEFCPDASTQATLNACASHIAEPVIVLEIGMSFKKSEMRVLGSEQLALIPEKPPTPQLRALSSMSNAAARKVSLLIPRYMRVPKISILAKVFGAEGNAALASSEAVEDLAWWTSSDREALPHTQVFVQAVKLGSHVLAIVSLAESHWN